MCNQGISEMFARKQEPAPATAAEAFRCNGDEFGDAQQEGGRDGPVKVGHNAHGIRLAQSNGGVIALIPVIVLKEL
jgi:hypothetical protein